MASTASTRARLLRITAAAFSALLIAGCGTAAQPQSQETTPGAAAADSEPRDKGGSITVYSGRSEELIQPILDRFEAETGIEVRVRYGGTSELAAALLEEGDRSPADLFIAQDAGALGAVATAGLFRPLPDEILNRVEARFRDPEGRWVGLSGRARVVAYNTERLSPEDLPDTLDGFTDPKWKGRIGWPPTNGSFQAFVTALRKVKGEEGARAWLEGILANEPRVYPKNTPAVAAVAAGEIDVAFVNHYYLYRFLAEHGPSFKARNYHPRGGGAGALINVAGAGVLQSSRNAQGAERLIGYFLTKPAQQYFAGETYEYPLIPGVEVHEELVPLSEIKTPDLDLGSLEDLEGTLQLLREVGAL